MKAPDPPYAVKRYPSGWALVRLTNDPARNVIVVAGLKKAEAEEMLVKVNAKEEA